MRILRTWLHRLGGLFGKASRDHELAAEIESHLQLHIDDNIRTGMTPEEARRQAILEFGAVESIKESYRDRRGVPLIDTLMRDVAWGWRVLRRDPGFAFVAVLTLALGIAATTAVFSIVDAVLLRPLPYPQAERLVSLNAVDEENPGRMGRVSANIVVALRERATTVEQVVAYESYEGGSVTLLDGEEPRLVTVGRASDGFFELFGGTAMLGRTLIPADHLEGAERVVVLSHALWQSAWGGNATIVGESVSLSDEPYLVVGVMPPQFRSPEAVHVPSEREGVDLWMPLQLRSGNSGNNLEYVSIGRLAADATLEAAEAEADAIVAAATANLPMRFSGRVTPLQAHTVGDIGDTLAVFLAAAVLLLLIACANVAYLLLSRGVQRRPELVLRTALGAHRGRVARQLLVESLLLAAMGGAAGTALAYVVVGVFQAADPGTIPRFAEVAVDSRILGFALVLASLTGVVFGLAPVLQLSRNNPSLALREGAASFSDGRSARRLRSALVVAQTALALVLLVGAGLLVNSFVALASVDAGFDPTGLALLEVRVPVSFADRALATPFFDELLEHTRAIPGVEGAALTTAPPYAIVGSYALVPEGWEQAAEAGEQPFIRATAVSANYFAVMEIPVLAGRPFDERDRPGTAIVALVNDAFVRAYWPGKDALGKRIRAGFGRLSAEWLTVGGVVGDVRSRPASDADPEVFALASQQPWHTMTVVARSRGDAADLIPAMRQAVWAIDPDLPIRRATTMDAITSELVAGPRFYALLSSSFAGAALVLALVGVYGTAAHAANRRRREISIRSALGAEAAAIVRMVVRDGVVLAVIGVLIGAVASRLAGSFLSGLLFGVTEGDVATLAGCAVLFVATSCVASLIPALRAARTDPVAALRADR